MSKAVGFAPRVIFVAIIAVVMTFFNNAQLCAQVGELEVREGTGIPAEVRNMYRKGADYLAKTQNDDGSWGKGGGGHGDETAGTAALATMAFLSTGEDPNFGKYARNVRAALRFIIRKQNDKTGYVPGNMYVHGFAMLALSEAFGVVDEDMLWEGERKKDRKIGEALELAVKLAVSSQKKNPSKAWRYSPNAKDADTSIAGAVLMGLLAARNAGVDVPDSAIDGALKYMKQLTSADTGAVGYSGMGGLGGSGARSAIACLVFAIGKRKKWKDFEGTKKFLIDSIDASAQQHWPYYERYYKAQALFQADYKSWQQWNRNTVRLLRTMQDDDGSIGNSGHGKAYSTSMSLLALALNYRFLPIYER